MQNIGKRTYCQMSAPVAVASTGPEIEGGGEGEGSGGGGGETASNEEEEETSSSSLESIRTPNGPFKIYKVRNFQALSQEEIKSMHKHAESNYGRCVSTIMCENGMVKYICAFGHAFKLPVTTNSEWCNKCTQLLHNLSEYAKSMNGTVKVLHKEKKFNLICNKGHQWELNIKYNI